MSNFHASVKRSVHEWQAAEVFLYEGGKGEGVGRKKGRGGENLKQIWLLVGDTNK